MNQFQVSDAVASAAERYRKLGYEVTFEPRPQLLPKEVRHYRPDFVAVRGDEHVAVEVKPLRALSANPQLTDLAEKFRRVPGWRLDLAVVAEDQPENPRPLLTVEEIANRIAAADTIAAEAHDYAAALLLLWTTIEAMLVARLEALHEDRLIAPSRLPKLAYSFGVIGEEDLPLLEWLATMRNDVVHGRTSTGVSPAEYQRARQLAARLLIEPMNEDQGGAVA